MAAGGCCHVVGGAGFAPAVAELTRTAAEAGTHVGIAKGKDGAGLIDALGNHKLEVATASMSEIMTAVREDALECMRTMCNDKEIVVNTLKIKQKKKLLEAQSS